MVESRLFLASYEQGPVFNRRQTAEHIEFIRHGFFQTVVRTSEEARTMLRIQEAVAY
ncbi:Hypothetical predicted protein [Podarcis lilfordi]|uniref:Uncharacterized protein n=1 Tax=Podarcis lilfordi TaxID=74358 RepID=A0AA35KZ09_9SAUR|nr:Hypothetical predicted protein [Podarcis lilfordi]